MPICPTTLDYYFFRFNLSWFFKIYKKKKYLKKDAITTELSFEIELLKDILRRQFFFKKLQLTKSHHVFRTVYIIHSAIMVSKKKLIIILKQNPMKTIFSSPTLLYIHFFGSRHSFKTENLKFGPHPTQKYKLECQTNCVFSNGEIIK